jgi:hypothetical protein
MAPKAYLLSRLLDFHRCIYILCFLAASPSADEVKAGAAESDGLPLVPRAASPSLQSQSFIREQAKSMTWAFALCCLTPGLDRGVEKRGPKKKPVERMFLHKDLIDT